MQRLLIIFLIGSALTSCSTYSTARKHIATGGAYSENQRYQKSLIEYSRALENLEYLSDNPQTLLIRAGVYHRLYLLDAVNVYNNSSDSVRQKCPALRRLLEGNKEINFLQKAFDDVLAIETKDAAYEYSKEYRFLLAEKNIIAGDYLRWRVNSFGKSAEQDEFVNTVKHYAYYEVAHSFYLAAVAQAATADDGFIKKISAERLAESCISILSLLKSFNEGQAKNWDTAPRLKYYEAVINGLRNGGLPGQFSKTDILFDGSFHLQEARNRFSVAIEKMVGEKPSDGLPDLFETLKSFIRAKELGGKLPPEMTGLVDNALSDVYQNLYRLTLSIQ